MLCFTTVCTISKKNNLSHFLDNLVLKNSSLVWNQRFRNVCKKYFPFKICAQIFLLLPFEVVEKLSKWSHALSKTSPKQFGRRPEWKIQFQSCRICRHFEELAKLSASRKTFIQAKKKKVCFKALRLQQFDWSKQFFNWLFYFILFFKMICFPW